MIDWRPLPSKNVRLLIDVANNILLFFPYGVAFFIHRRKNARASLSILSSAVSAIFLSSFCETAQVWLPPRSPQVLDVVADTFGAFGGATAAAVWERINALTSPDEVRNGILWSPASGVLLSILALSLLYPVFHLDPVRSVNELKVHAKTFIQSPLFDRWSMENVFLPMLLLGGLSFSLADWAMTSFPSLHLPFVPADNPVATPSPLESSFYLGKITPPLSQGVTYYLSLRTVTADGMKSDFSPPVSFSP